MREEQTTKSDKENGRKEKRRIRKRRYRMAVCLFFCFAVLTLTIEGCIPQRQGDSGSDSERNRRDGSTDLTQMDGERTEADFNSEQPDSESEQSDSGSKQSDSESEQSDSESEQSDSESKQLDSGRTDSDSSQKDHESGHTDSSSGQQGSNFGRTDSGQSNSISVDVTAKNVVVMQADTGLVLYQKKGADRIAPASTAKMITALTVLDICSEEDEVTVGTEIMLMHEDSSRAWLNQGDTLTVRQLLIALLLPSGNDAAYTLAVYSGRKLAGDSSLSDVSAVDVFMTAVNEKACELGAENSNFAAPDGYDAKGQYTTAMNLAILAKACLDEPCIAEIVSDAKSYERWTGGREVTYQNSNKLLDPDSPFYYPEATGIKTGTSSLAGASLISSAVINGKTYICVVMGAASDDERFQDSIAIYDAIKTLDL